jgi:mRNA interferase MazF
MNRGEIYWANLSPRSGSEQTGRRPVIVVSHDGFNHDMGWRSVLVVPMTTSLSQAKRGLTAVQVPGSATGLRKASVALCHQVTTLDRSKFTKRIGVLSPDSLREVDGGLKVAMDLE